MLEIGIVDFFFFYDYWIKGKNLFLIYKFIVLKKKFLKIYVLFYILVFLNENLFDRFFFEFYEVVFEINYE